jgi:hypothetical protein
MQKISPFFQTKWGWNYGENDWKDGMDENILKLSLLSKNSVSDLVSSLPSNPLNGSSYYLTTANRIYFYVEGKEYYFSPEAGYKFTNLSNNQEYFYNGSVAVMLPNYTTELSTKVDKIDGKQLSTNDYTTTEKVKLNGIAVGAQVNVPTNLSVNSTATTVVISSSTGNNAGINAATATIAGILSAADKTKLDGIATGATANNNTDQLGEGTTNLYYTDNRVRNVTFPTISGVNTAIANGDNLTTVVNKTQGQLNNKLATTGTAANSSQLGGVPAASFIQNPMTTQGDLIVGGLSGLPTRLPIGPNTYFLSSNGTTTTWLPPSSMTGVFTKEYISPEQTITSGGLLTLTHNLGARPKFWCYSIVCKISEGGYAVGEELMLPGTQNLSSPYGIAISPDSTTLSCRIGTSLLFIINKAGNNTITITPANWRIIVRAWA